MRVYPNEPGPFSLRTDRSIGQLLPDGRFQFPTQRDWVEEADLVLFSLLPDDFGLKLESGDFVTMGRLRKSLRDLSKRTETSPYVYPLRIQYQDQAEDEPVLTSLIPPAYEKVCLAAIRAASNITRTWRAQFRSLVVEGQTHIITLLGFNSLGAYDLTLRLIWTPDGYIRHSGQIVYQSESVKNRVISLNWWDDETEALEG